MDNICEIEFVMAGKDCENDTGKRSLDLSSTESTFKKSKPNECLVTDDDAAVDHSIESTTSIIESDQCAINKSQDEQNDLHSKVFNADILSPNECLKMISYSLCGFIPKFRSSLTMPPSFFLSITPENISSYTNDVVSAIRDSDISALRSTLKQPGSTLECCNRFGESALHLACRRGLLNVVTFMIDEAEVSLRMRDDFGRTPLHDACWNREPVWEIMDILIRKDPTLLFLADKRGFTPFQYARKEHWNLWREFLYNRRACFVIHKDSLKKYLC